MDKPRGMTSRAAGGRVARMFGVKKFGHLGTLDPMAAGVLPIALGEATKMIPYIDGNKESAFAEASADKQETGEKEYIFTVIWGIETDTGDIDGKVITESTFKFPDNNAVAAACKSMVGEISQVPPAYSAVHVNGRRAYELARRGETVNLPKRKVTIYSLEYDADSADHVFRVCCGTGTYVRALARDIAEKCGTVATCAGIYRVRTHNFSVENAQSLDFLEKVYHNAPAELQDYLKPADFGLDDILVAELNDDDASLFKHGGVIVTKDDSLGLRRVKHNGKFIGIGRNDNYVLMPKRIINA